MKNLTTTIDLDGIELEVNYDYDSGEVGQRYDSNRTGTPDIGESVTICAVMKGGDDIVDLLSQETIEKIENKLLGT